MNIKHGNSLTNILDMPEVQRPPKKPDITNENGTRIPGEQPPDPDQPPHIDHFHIKYDHSAEVNNFLNFYIEISIYHIILNSIYLF